MFLCQHKEFYKSILRIWQENMYYVCQNLIYSQQYNYGYFNLTISLFFTRGLTIAIAIARSSRKALLFFSPFFLPPNKRGKKKGSMNNQSSGQKTMHFCSIRQLSHFLLFFIHHWYFCCSYIYVLSITIYTRKH